ncbi:MAG TPA: phosphoribosyltransferase family protein [Terriglobia bacterium]|nr:phosphoribosyltransferase family protein [Terriglobia bacterium]
MSTTKIASSRQRVSPAGITRRSRPPNKTEGAKAWEGSVSSAMQEGAGLRVVFTERQIQQRVAQMASRINHDYHGRTLHIVTALDNSFMFLADLMRQLQMTVVCHFLKAQVKDRTWHGLPLREIKYVTSTSLGGKHVLLVDGVLQTGVTEDFLLHSIQDQEPYSLRTATLIEKMTQRKVNLTPDYVGFTAEERFLVGYGLGLNGEYAHLPYIAEVQQEVAAF